MKQKVGMVLCVLLGAALVMMCDSDAVQDISDVVQDMVDGDEASANDSASGPASDSEPTTATDCEPAEAAGLSELAGITCPEGSVLATGVRTGTQLWPNFYAACWSKTTKALNGPAIERFGTGEMSTLTHYSDGRKHGLEARWEMDPDGYPYEYPFEAALCTHKDGGPWGSTLWYCAPGEVERTHASGDSIYECSTFEEAEALAAEHGCP